ncbi:hypothetical protein, partial [Frateuria defendens]|uniref:hypothetical protein n=1 Tax=Frateuria defendens TaxID=2219559 RepID=UPI001F378C0E
AKAFYGVQEYGVNLRGSTSNDDAQAAQLSHWANQDVLKNYLANDIIKQSDNDFYAFYGRTVVYGATAGLSAGVPFLEAANAVREGGISGTVLGFMLSSRVGAGMLAGTVNAGAQLAQDGKIRLTNVGVATATGMLGVGGGLWWNTAVSASGGFLQTDINNMVYDESKNPYIGAAKSGVTGGFGYYVGDKTTRGLGGVAGETLLPAIFGNTSGPISSESSSAIIDRLGDSPDSKEKK